MALGIRRHPRELSAAFGWPDGQDRAGKRPGVGHAGARYRRGGTDHGHAVDSRDHPGRRHLVPARDRERERPVCNGEQTAGQRLDGSRMQDELERAVIVQMLIGSGGADHLVAEQLR